MTHAKKLAVFLMCARAMLLVSEAENGNSIKCPYHGRSFRCAEK